MRFFFSYVRTFASDFKKKPSVLNLIINPELRLRESIEHRKVQGPFSKLLSPKTQKTMNKKQNVFTDNIRIETQTIYAENGNINIYPCAFEENPHLVAHATDSGSRYNTLQRTAHGEVKETKGDYIFTLRFPKKLGKATIEAFLCMEQEEQQNFFNELNETED